MSDDHRIRRALAQPAPRLLVAIIAGAFAFSASIEIATSLLGDLEVSNWRGAIVLAVSVAVAVAAARLANRVIRELGSDDLGDGS